MALVRNRFVKLVISCACAICMCIDLCHMLFGLYNCAKYLIRPQQTCHQNLIYNPVEVNRHIDVKHEVNTYYIPYRIRVYTHPVGVLATSHGVQGQPDPSGFSIYLGVPVQVAR